MEARQIRTHVGYDTRGSRHRLWWRWMEATPDTLKKPIIICRTDGREGFYYQLPGKASEFARTLDEALAAVDRWWSERSS